MATKKAAEKLMIDTHVRIIADSLEKVIKANDKDEVTRNAAAYMLVGIIASALPAANCILHSTHIKHRGTKVDITLHFSDADGNGWPYIEQHIPAKLSAKGKTIAECLKCGLLIDTWDENDKSGMCVVAYKKAEKLSKYKNADKKPWNSNMLENFIKKCSAKKA